MFNDGGTNKNGSQQLIKETNIRRVFKLVSLSNGISRAELANVTGLSPTTVSSLIEELIFANLIIEAGRMDIPTSGRKPIILKINKKGGCIVAADLHEYGYSLAVFDLGCSLVKENIVDLPDYRNLGKSLIDEIEKILESGNYMKKNILGICIGAPGIIDRKNKRILSSTLLPIDGGNKFMNQLQQKYEDARLELVNESSLSAYAEKEYGRTTGDIDNLIYIDIHTGIGAGIIINGKIYEGSDFLAGEFGHVSVDLNGPMCKCGSRGCLETLAGIPALIDAVENSGGLPSEYPADGTLNEKFAIVSKDFKKKGEFREEIFLMAKYIAYGINNAVNLLNPGAVVIGGKAAELGDGFLLEILRILDSIGLDSTKRTKVMLSKIMQNPVTAGGAKHIFNLLF